MSVASFRIGLALIVITIGIAFWSGYNIASEEYASKIQEAKRQIERKQSKLDEITPEVEIRYVEKIKEIRVKGETIVKSVPVYITPEMDSRCSIPDAFVSLHDSAANNTLPISSGSIDATTTGIEISDVAEVVTDNYLKYHIVSQQLRDLQQWVIEVQATANK